MACCLVSIPLNLLLEGADRCVDRGKLPLHPIAPEGEHPHFAFLMTTHAGGSVVLRAAANEGGKHGKLMECLKVLAS
jgi:hypothetical protein